MVLFLISSQIYENLDNFDVSTSHLAMLIKPWLLFFIFSLLTFPVHASEPGTEAAKPFPESRFTSIDSASFHYRVWNDQLADPKGKVLLIHGFVGSTFCWRENIDTLVKEGYFVVAVDLPGAGFSDRSLMINQSQSNRARMLWDLLSKIDHSESSHWNLVGHSMGGGTAEAMALMKPDRIQTLTIVDGMVFKKNKSVNGSFVVLTQIKETNKVLVDLTKKRVIDFERMQKLLKGLYGYIPDSSIVEGYLRPLQLDGSAECMLNVFANAKEIQPLHVDSLGNLPVLIVWGKKDRTIRWFSAKNVIKSFPPLELRIIPEAYHSPMETHPGVFNRYLVEFLNKNN